MEELIVLVAWKIRPFFYVAGPSREDYGVGLKLGLPSGVRTVSLVGCFAIHQNSVCLENIWNVFYETDELPNSPRPTQPNPRKLGSKVTFFGPLFFSPQQLVFRAVGLVLYRKQTTRDLTQSNSPQTPHCFLRHPTMCSMSTSTLPQKGRKPNETQKKKLSARINF